MSFNARLYLNCNGPDCEHHLMESGAPSKKRLWDQAQDDGWGKFGNSHFCPSCVEKLSDRLEFKNLPKRPEESILNSSACGSTIGALSGESTSPDQIQGRMPQETVSEQYAKLTPQECPMCQALQSAGKYYHCPNHQPKGENESMPVKTTPKESV